MVVASQLIRDSALVPMLGSNLLRAVFPEFTVSMRALFVALAPRVFVTRCLAAIAVNLDVVIPFLTHTTVVSAANLVVVEVVFLAMVSSGLENLVAFLIFIEFIIVKFFLIFIKLKLFLVFIVLPLLFFVELSKLAGGSVFVDAWLAGFLLGNAFECCGDCWAQR